MNDSSLAFKQGDLMEERKKAESNISGYKIQFLNTEIEVQNDIIINQIEGV